MSIFSTAKSAISIGTQAAAGTLVGMQGDTYTVIGEPEDLGSVGFTAEEVKFASVTDGWQRRRRGVMDGGMIELVVARDPADAGQIALRAAARSASQDPYSFKIELSDKPSSGASPKNTNYFFKAVVMSVDNKLGGPNEIVKTVFNLGVTGEVFEVNASAS